MSLLNVFCCALMQLLRLGVNFKNFPKASVPATFAALFHVGIAAVLCLYVLFWLKVYFFTISLRYQDATSYIAFFDA